MKFLSVSLILLLCLIWARGNSPFHTASPTHAQAPTTAQKPLSLRQVENLVRNPAAQKDKAAKDRAIATEIRRRGIDFYPDASVLDNLRKLGAGPLTIEAVKVSKSEGAKLIERTTAPPNEIVILVAKFSNSDNDNNNYEIQEQILSQLRKSTSNYQNIVVKALEDAITGKQGKAVAIAKAKEQGANIIIWGWFTKLDDQVRVTANFEIVGGLPTVGASSSEVPTGDQVFTGDLLELKNFTIQTRLSSELTAITLFATGLAHSMRLDTKAAISQFSEALRQTEVGRQKTPPKSIIDVKDIHLARGTAYLMEVSVSQTGSLKNASEDFSEVIRADDKNSEARLMRAYCFLFEKNYDDAISDAKRVLEYETDKDALITANHFMGLLHFQRGEVNEANKFFDELLRVSEGHAENPNTLMFRGTAYMVKKDYYNALRSFDAGLKVSDAPALNAAFHFNKGVVYKAQEDFERAIKEFDETLRLAPNLIYALQFRGQSYSEMGKTERAMEDFEACLKLNPQFADVYVDRGIEYYQKGDRGKALKDYNKALELNPNLKWAYYHRGFTYSAMGQLDHAISDFTTFLKLEPGDVMVLERRGTLYISQGNFDAAIKDCSELIKLAPNFTRAFFLCGDAYSGKGLHGEAIKSYTEAIKLNKYNARAYIARGKVHAAMGSRELAIADFKQVFEITSDPQLRQEARQQLNLLGVK